MYKVSYACFDNYKKIYQLRVPTDVPRLSKWKSVHVKF